LKTYQTEIEGPTTKIKGQRNARAGERIAAFLSDQIRKRGRKRLWIKPVGLQTRIISGFAQPL
jgi:hypothetical protein